jgi:hypothetical protein
MQMLDILPHLNFTSISEAINLIRPQHIEAIKNKDLKSTTTVRIFLNSGRSLEGYILDTDGNSSHSLTLIEGDAAMDDVSVSLVNISDIESFEFTQMSKVYQLFAGDKLYEGLGEPPTKLNLKKEHEAVINKFKEGPFSGVAVDINIEDFLKADAQKAGWSVIEIFKSLTSFLEHKDIDEDFVSAFKEKVDTITIVNSEQQKLALSGEKFEISIDTSKGIQGAPKSNNIYDYLYGAL